MINFTEIEWLQLKADQAASALMALENALTYAGKATGIYAGAAALIYESIKCVADELRTLIGSVASAK